MNALATSLQVGSYKYIQVIFEDVNLSIKISNKGDGYLNNSLLWGEWNLTIIYPSRLMAYS